MQTVNCIQTGGSTAYATAIDEAQALLNAQGRPDAQDVIIFFTDGEANYGPWYYGNNSPYRKTPCAQAISSANAAKATGTWVYTIGYDTDVERPLQGLQVDREARAARAAPQNKGKQFPCDEQAIKTAYWTLQQMASTIDGQLKFYYQPTPGDLTTIFERVALDLTQVSARSTTTRPSELSLQQLRRRARARDRSSRARPFARFRRLA